ncbi:MAG TPA: RluA family pseudouridine synthase [Patescibacteria group bacterium]|nr:RluA family pseudouridine synthase [Patescibacteria group bacterium]
MSNPQIIYKDTDLIIIDKPSGWVVNRAESVKVPTVQDWLDSELDFKKEVGESKNLKNNPADDFTGRSGIVHRIDKETSGLLLIARNENSFKKLQDQFAKRIVEKTYICLVHGKLDMPEGIIDAPVGRLPWNRERFGVLPGGRNALTRYKLIREYIREKEYFSLLEIYPKTGRTHQIRIHMKHLGHPIVSDTFYAGRKTARNDRQWCGRIFLHAAKITFIQPTKEKQIIISTPLPVDLSQVIKNLKVVPLQPR